MRYLYGDSVPSPIQYNFLTAFETFIEAAAQAVRLDQDIARAQAKLDAAANAREHALEIVEAFHRKAMESLDSLLGQQQDPNTSVYVRQLREHGEGIVSEARSNCQVAKDKTLKEHGPEFEARRKELASAVERFLKTEIVPVLGWSISMRLADGQNHMTSVLNHPGEIITSFAVTPSQGSMWHGPVRVASLVQGLDLQLGTRKSWITGSVARSAISLDDFLIGGFELSDDTAEIRLRKRTDQPDTFLFKLDRKDEVLRVQLERRGDDDTESSVDLDEDERTRMEKLWQMMRQSVRSTVRPRGRLLTVRVEGQDLFTGGRVRSFLERVVDGIAPTVQQIIAHSPNPAELSMKIESDEGRREEIYVRRELLAAKIEALDEDGRALFSSLDLVSEALTSADVDVVV